MNENVGRSEVNEKKKLKQKNKNVELEEVMEVKTVKEGKRKNW